MARGIFHALNKVWISKDLKKATKIEVFETLVLSVLLYNSETWNMKATFKRRIRVFEMACLRKIEGVTRRDRLRNSETQTRLNWNYDIEHRIQQRRLKYFGHVVRMSQNRFPSIVMHGRVAVVFYHIDPSFLWSPLTPVAVDTTASSGVVAKGKEGYHRNIERRARICDKKTTS